MRCGGGEFNFHFGFCDDCKSNNNSESITKLNHTFRAFFASNYTKLYE
jgi:hypothetical protein